VAAIPPQILRLKNISTRKLSNCNMTYSTAFGSTYSVKLQLQSGEQACVLQHIFKKQLSPQNIKRKQPHIR